MSLRAIYLLCLFSGLLSWPNAILAKSVNVDSLIVAAKEATVPKEKAGIWTDVAKVFLKRDIDSALWAARHGINSMKPDAENLDMQRVNLIRFIGYCHSLRLQFDSAQHYLNSAHQQARDKEYNELIGIILLDWSTYYKKRNESNKAIATLRKSCKWLAQYNPDRLFEGVNQMGAYMYYSGNHDSAFIIFKEAAVIARKSNDMSQMAMVLMNLGIMYDINAKPDSALHYYRLSIVAGEDAGDYSRLGQAHMNLGTFYEERNYINGAIKEFQKAISYFEKIKNDRSVFMAVENTVLAYTAINNKKLAWKYLQFAGEILKKNQFVDGKAYHYKGLANYYQLENNIDSILKYTLATAREFEKLRAICEATQQYHNAISIASAEGEMGYDTLLQRIKGLDSNCSGQVIHSNLRNQGDIYFYKGELQLAEDAYNKALAFFEESNYLQSIQSTLIGKIQIEEARGNYEEAFALSVKVSEINDSIFNIDREQEINYLELQLQEAETQILQSQATINEELINSQKELLVQKDNLNIALAAVGSLILIIAGLLFFFRQKDHKLNARLAAQNEHIKQNEALEESNRQKDNLMGIVAHDLGSPLRGIKGMAQMMLDLDEFTEENLRLILEAADGGINLTTELLEANKFMTVKDRPKENVDLKKLLQKITDLNRQAAERKNIALQLSAQDDVSLYTSPESLHRSIDNLVSNAIKFSEPNKRVWIKAEKQDSKVLVVVKDEGQGFSEHDMKKVFQPFQKLSARPTNNEGSTGLGLSIVKKLIEDAGGEIALKSEKGQGAEFTIELPVME